ncbi:MAG: EVE domain-containing protein [Methanobacteriota archaeon]
MTTTHYWIIVASQEHVKLGVAGGFAQAGHGKRQGLARMHAGDRIIYYSPKIEFGGVEPLHAFTALGEVEDDEIVQVEMSPDFQPFRRKVKYDRFGVVHIEPLVNDLEFIRNKKSWGYAFRFGLLEIQRQDFERIEQAFEKQG